MAWIEQFTAFFLYVFGPLVLIVLINMLGGAFVIAVFWMIADALQLPGGG